MMNLLGNGYLRVIETWGSDERIIESARMSTAKGFLGWGESPCSECGGSGEGPDKIDGPGDVYQLKCERCDGNGRTVGDEKLLRFLYENQHSTPFEFAGMTVEVQAPIMVFREWHRHRTQSYSELSARYTPLPADDYVPSPDRLLIANTTNKQASAVKGADELTLDSALEWQRELIDVYEQAERVYQSGLKRGVPKELARLPVPVGRYSRMRAQANLRNWLGFLTLRTAPNAQWEIRQYANALAQELRGAFPRTMELFDGRA